jgi:spore coat protein H
MQSRIMLPLIIASLLGCAPADDLASLPTARPLTQVARHEEPAVVEEPVATLASIPARPKLPDVVVPEVPPVEEPPPVEEAPPATKKKVTEKPVESAPVKPAVEPAPVPVVPEKPPVAPAPEVPVPQPPAIALAPLSKPAPNPSDDFFKNGVIPELRIRLSDKEAQQLRADQRRYVDCTFIEDGKTTYKKVKMKLKGAAGSFRNLDDRPAITLSMRKKDERFHGLAKFHLNNSVQDESYLNELMASQICAEAGCPAARTTHARVWLNDRDLGFYVLKEGLDDQFLARHFSNPKGNLYDGGFCQDIDAKLEKDEGDGVEDLSDIQALIAACREGDQTKRWQMVQEKVDIDAFLNFVAMELMMCHWDGYCQNRNNYRIYFDADTKKVHFFPHGMDQMFADPNFSVFHVPGPIVASAVLNNPDWRIKYRQRVRELLPLFAPEKLHKQMDVAAARIRPVLEKIHPDRAKQFDDRVRDAKNRVNDRQKIIRNQFPPEPIPLNAEGWAVVEGWEPKPEGDAKLEKKEISGVTFLSIETGPSNRCTSSFRTKVRLGKGSYRFEAKVKPTNVTPIPGDTGVGAGVRISGLVRTNQAVGTSDWQTVAHVIDVAEELREFDLVAELRSTSGGVLFEQASLRVVKVK